MKLAGREDWLLKAGQAAYEHPGSSGMEQEERTALDIPRLTRTMRMKRSTTRPALLLALCRPNGTNSRPASPLSRLEDRKPLD